MVWYLAKVVNKYCISSFDTQLNAASEHIVNYLDGKDKEILGTTYKDLKDMTERIIGCGYFDNPHAEEEVVEEEAQDDCKLNTLNNSCILLQ